MNKNRLSWMLHRSVSLIDVGGIWCARVSVWLIEAGVKGLKGSSQNLHFSRTLGHLPLYLSSFSAHSYWLSSSHIKNLHPHLDSFLP
jgi:hypothetical protein